MSYNIDAIRMIDHFDLSMSRQDMDYLLDEYEDDLPEDCFLNYPHTWENDVTKIDGLAWSGVGSGSSWEIFTNDVFKRIKGDATFIVVWECGDTLEWYHLDNGKLTRIRSL